MGTSLTRWVTRKGAETPQKLHLNPSCIHFFNQSFTTHGKFYFARMAPAFGGGMGCLGEQPVRRMPPNPCRTASCC